MDTYYMKQAENGMSEGFSSGSPVGHGSNRHVGRGFFTSALGLVTRALPFLGRSLLNTAVNVVEGMKNNGENSTSVKEALKKSAVDALDSGLETVKMKAKRTIMGAGRRRKKPTVHKKGKVKKIGGRRRHRRTSSKVKGGVLGGRRGRKRVTKFSPHLW